MLVKRQNKQIICTKCRLRHSGVVVFVGRTKQPSQPDGLLWVTSYTHHGYHTHYHTYRGRAVHLSCVCTCEKDKLRIAMQGIVTYFYIYDPREAWYCCHRALAARHPRSTEEKYRLYVLGSPYKCRRVLRNTSCKTPPVLQIQTCTSAQTNRASPYTLTPTPSESSGAAGAVE